MFTTRGFGRWIGVVSVAVQLACGGATLPPDTPRAADAPEPPADPKADERGSAHGLGPIEQVLSLPPDQQSSAWQKLAAVGEDPKLQRLALEQLAYLDDPDGVRLATAALKSEHESVRATAAQVLAYYGPMRAHHAATALLHAGGSENEVDDREIAWALVVLGEPRVVGRALEMTRQGALGQARRLDGGEALEPLALGRLLQQKVPVLLGNKRSEMDRWMAAAALAARDDPADLFALGRLASDPSAKVRAAAAIGLARRGDTKSRAQLAGLLGTSNRDDRQQYLKAVRDHVGGNGLLLAIDAAGLTGNVKDEWFRTKEVFDLLVGPTDESEHGLNDPRAADALLRYIETQPHIHWQVQAARGLAQIGDLRAIPTLARRLRMDPLKIYSDDHAWERQLKRDDRERVVAARHVADLAMLHPDRLDYVREQAESAVAFWITEMPSPHHNGMRALAAMRTAEEADLLRDWANPQAALPVPGQQPPMPEAWVIAQSAMRYVGVLQDKTSWPVLTGALRARPRDVDVTMDSLMQGGLAILGMSLRAIGVGAANGLSEWQDPRAFAPLLAYAEDRRENEQSRMEACAALPWVATGDDMGRVVDAIDRYSGKDPADQFRRLCLLEALGSRPSPAAAATLTQLVVSELEDPNLGAPIAAARALGRTALKPEVEQTLLDALRPHSREGAAHVPALALLLGGSRAAAIRAAIVMSTLDRTAQKQLQTVYYRSFGWISAEDLENGSLFRWVRNAVAIATFSGLDEKDRRWTEVLLRRQFDNLMFDNGPHSLTRIALRVRLMRLARSQDARTRRLAIETLRLAQERGPLLALSREPGELGWLARRAHLQILRPAGEPRGFEPTDSR